MNIEIKLLIKLIRAHYDNDESAFKDVCEEVIKCLDDNNIDEEIKHYIWALMGIVPTWSPM